MKNTKIRYERVLNEKCLDYFKEHGLLNCIVSNPTLPNEDKFHELKEFDVQFREHNNVAVYCGLTKILNIKFYQRGIVPFKFQSDAYKTQSCFPVIQNYTDQHLIQESIREYFNNVAVGPKWWNKEGVVQTMYYSSCATNWNKTKPVAIFDKEIVFGYTTSSLKEEFNKKYGEQVDLIKQKLKGSKKWAQFKNILPDEIDLLGISPDGESLFLLEVKANHANPAQIYSSPFQLLYYLFKLKGALQDNPDLVTSINELVRQKIEIGLLPADFPVLTHVKRIIPVLAVEKKCWSGEVHTRLKSVLKCINENSNNDLGDFEIWEIKNGDIKRSSI